MQLSDVASLVKLLDKSSLTEISFKAGVATYLEVADANSALTSAEVGAISERLQTSLAALRLLRSARRYFQSDRAQLVAAHVPVDGAHLERLLRHRGIIIAAR